MSPRIELFSLLGDDEVVLVPSAQIVLQFNYVIDDRWRLWLYRKWKHDITRVCGENQLATWAVHGRKQQWVARPSAEAQRNRKRKKRERNEFEKCESEWERIMNKLKWTVMLIISFSGWFATLLVADSFSLALRRRLKTFRIKFRLRKSDFRGWKQQTSRVENVIRNKMHSSCSVNCFRADLSSAVDDFPPPRPLTLVAKNPNN